MQDRVKQPGDFTFDDFLAFIEDRPDEERWELIDGVIEMNASPANLHQIVTSNLIALLWIEARRTGAPWFPLPGLGIHEPAQSRWAPVPDVIVRPRSQGSESFCADAIVIIEVLSPSTKRKDLFAKRSYYCSLATVQHYAIVTPDELLVRQYDRADGWQELVRHDVSQALELPAIGVTLGLADVYRNTGMVDEPA